MMAGMQILTEHGEVTMMYAAGGDAGNLTNDAITKMFGNGKKLIIVDDAGILELYKTEALIRGVTLRDAFVLLISSIWYSLNKRPK